MKKWSEHRNLKLLLVLASTTTLGFAQEKSLIYNDNQQLRADTTISITKEAYNIWLRAEEEILFHFINCYAPNVLFQDMGVNVSCVFSFQVDSVNGFNNVLVVNHLDRYKNGEKYHGLLTNQVFNCLKSIAGYKTTALKKKTHPEMVFYLPLQSDIVPVDKFVGTDGILKILTPTPPLIMAE